jgi:Spy/CpxP family protein refolding chaperone
MTLFAQGKEEKREQIKALKVSHITTELNLTSEQSAKFWPVYNEFEEKQFRIRHDKMKSLHRKIDEAGIDKLSDKEANAYLNQMEDIEEELLALRKQMVADLKAIIGPVKVLKLKKAEDTFNKKLLSKYKGKKK